MKIPDDLIREARTGDRQAVEALLTAVCPAVWRIAVGLTGSARAGSTVAKTVLRQSVRVMPDWHDGITPENWFYHHTVLATRPIDEERGEDVLRWAESQSDVASRAFLLALRGLPRQQREAFILRAGEHLNTRLLGIAMDCSASAAQVHLDAAESALRSLAGDDFGQMTSQIAAAYASLTPSRDRIAQIVGREASRGRRPEFSALFARRIAFLMILLSLALAGWHWRGQVLEWVKKLRSLDTPATQPTGAK